MTSANPKTGSYQQLLGWGAGWGTERKVEKRAGNIIKKKIKIHAGLNKLRSSASGILDLGFETQRVSLPLAIWLF